MSAWIEGKVYMSGKGEDDTAKTLNRLSYTHFPGAVEYMDSFHSTLLYIGEGFEQKQLIEPFNEAGVGDFLFRGSQYVPIIGGEKGDKILMTYDCPTQCLLFRKVYDLYKEYGIQPQHQFRNFQRWYMGFTPHVTLASFKNAEDAKASLEFGKNRFTAEMMKLSPEILLSDFHLFYDLKDPKTPGKILLA